LQQDALLVDLQTKMLYITWFNEPARSKLRNGRERVTHLFVVIPAKAGIRFFYLAFLDSRWNLSRLRRDGNDRQVVTLLQATGNY
jgi:hypothetical protein